MRTARVVLGLLGLAAMAWGAYQVWPLLRGLSPKSVSLAVWFLGGPVLHDLLFAPLVTGLALVAAKLLGPGWRGPVVVGGVLTGVLCLLAVPYLWREYGGATNPGLHDRDYLTGLLIFLAVVWAGVLLAGLAARLLSRRESASRATTRPAAHTPGSDGGA